jgi:hypothetical protein
MMPSPTHLRTCVIPDDAHIDELPFRGKVKCSCGGASFQLLYPGQTQECKGETIPCTADIDDDCFFLVKARCPSCKEEHLLIDQDFHGWNGFVCHDAEQAALPRPPLVPWKCLACGHFEHTAAVEIQTEGKEDFVSETDGEFDPNRWPDGFGWLTISTHCINCGKDSPQWVSLETM